MKHHCICISTEELEYLLRLVEGKPVAPEEKPQELLTHLRNAKSGTQTIADSLRAYKATPPQAKKLINKLTYAIIEGKTEIDA